MLVGTVVMLILTFGLSRLLLYITPDSIDNKRKIVIANSGSVLLITAIYVAIWASESDTGAGLIALGAVFAVICQAVWYWRDVSKLDLMPATSNDQLKSRTPLERNEVPVKRAGQPGGEREKFPANKWDALVRYDTDIANASEKLRPYGDKWITELGRAYFALEQDKQYLPTIVRRLMDDAEEEKQQARVVAFQQIADGGSYTENSLNILRRAEESGYTIIINNKAIEVSKEGLGTSILRTDSDIERFGRFARFKQS